tara:strand:+ start:115 stop:621 length:507 start_codon:yes stop_codon:yes gene_type:complete
MKKYLIILISTALFSNSLNAFEVYGIKSGITKDEYYALVDCQANVDKYNEGKTGRYDVKASLSWCEDKSLDLPYFEGMYPDRFMQWTHDNRLWRLQIRVRKVSGIIEELAQKRAMEAAFPRKEIIESSTTSQYGTTEYMSVMFIDDKLFQESLKFYKDIYLEKFNIKK